MALKEIAKVENMPLVKATATELTISGGAITVTQSFHNVDTEGDAASDDLATINGGVDQSMIVLQPANDARTVVIKHNTGNIWIPSGSDITLNDIKDALLLVYDSTNTAWIVVGWVSAGGGISNVVEDLTPQLGGDLDLNSKNIDFPSTADISDCKDEDDMASDSATMLATQQSIKAYVDTQVATKIGNVIEDTTPQLGGDLDLNSKNIDFPTTANISDCLDEDDMASNSATMLATQQSIKAYVDTQVATKIGNVSEDTTPQLGGDLDLNSHNIDFPSTANISDCLDEDDMASDSATALATQQSIKKYVDDNAGGTTTELLRIPAGTFNTKVASGYAEFAQIEGTNLIHGVLKFDKDTDEQANTDPIIFEDYNGGNMVATVVWRANATSGAVMLAIGLKGIADNEAGDAAPTWYAFAADTVGDVAYDWMIATLTFDPSAVLSAGEASAIFIKRDADNGSDTLAVDAEILSVQIEYTRS